MNLSTRHEKFYTLHQSGCFVIPNPWDSGSARLMAAAGAEALATTSSGHAFTLGRPDMGHVSRDEALSYAADILASTPLPVSGDFENGYGDAPEDVAETVRLAGEVGLSGCSIEDTAMSHGNPSYSFDLALERVQAGAAAARALGRPFVFCARADGVMNGSYDLREAMRRVQAFEAKGGTPVIAARKKRKEADPIDHFAYALRNRAKPHRTRLQAPQERPPLRNPIRQNLSKLSRLRTHRLSPHLLPKFVNMT